MTCPFRASPRSSGAWCEFLRVELCDVLDLTSIVFTFVPVCELHQARVFSWIQLSKLTSEDPFVKPICPQDKETRLYPRYASIRIDLGDLYVLRTGWHICADAGVVGCRGRGRHTWDLKDNPGVSLWGGSYCHTWGIRACTYVWVRVCKM